LAIPKKIYVRNNYVFVEQGNVVNNYLSKDIFVKIQDGGYLITVNTRDLFTIGLLKIGEIFKQDGTLYTEEGWIEFYTKSTGTCGGGNGSSGGSRYDYTAKNYTELITNYPVVFEGKVALVYEEQGSRWLFNYKPKGYYVFDGTSWISDPTHIVADEILTVDVNSTPLAPNAATETTLAAIKAKTDNIDVLLSTRTKPSDIQIVNTGLSQPLTNTELRGQKVDINLRKDAFGLQEVSQTSSLFDAQFTYDLQPILYENIATNGSVTHDAINRCALITSTGVGDVYLQSYDYLRYTPGKAQKIFITFNFRGVSANKTKFVQYGDGENAFGLRLLPNGTLEAYITTSTTQGNQSQTVNTALHGIDVTKEQILIIEFEALYVGSALFYFQIDQKEALVANFDNANNTTHPYIANANLPIRVGIIGSGAGTADMIFNCVSVQSSATDSDVHSYNFIQRSNKTAANNTRTHFCSVRPKALFNGILNRAKVSFLEIDITLNGNSPVDWELCIGQAISGTTTFTSVNDNSVCEFNTDGTISGSPFIAFEGGSIPSSGNTRGSVSRGIKMRYPITLDAAGNPRINGTISLVLTGVGGNVDARTTLKWVEIR
jgi:hypothetical protein